LGAGSGGGGADLICVRIMLLPVRWKFPEGNLLHL
jgi:hypothetical protein